MKKVYNITNLTEDEDGICFWEYMEDADYEVWETDCDRRFTFLAGTPKDNDFEYCPFCRRELIESLDK